jgi:hypothetical protein
MRHLCLACAAQEGSVPTRGERRLNRAAVFLTIGVMTLVLSAVADELKFGLREGFGHRQVAGLLIGGGMVIMGAVTRATTLQAIGMFATALTLLADGIRLGGQPGFGAHQMLGCAVGVALIVYGLWTSRHRAPPDS